MKKLKKLGKIKLMPEKLLSNEELVSFRGGSGSISEYCATQFAIISCNDNQPNNYFKQNCNQRPNGAAYWGAAVSYGIPMNQGSCDASWYGN